MLTAEQKSILFKSPGFLQQAGVIPKTSEQLSGTVNEEDINRQFDQIRSVNIDTSQSPNYNTQPTVPKKKGMLQKIGETLISSEKALGETYGTALASKSVHYKEALNAQQKASEYANKLALQIQQMEKSGKSTASAKQKYFNITGREYGKGTLGETDITAGGILGEAADKTGKQIAGETLGVGLDLLGGASVGKAVKGVKAIKTIGEGVKVGAKTGVKYGTAYGVAEGMKENKDIKGIIGEGLIGGATGAIVGGATGGIAGKIAQNKATKGLVDLEKTKNIFAPKLTTKTKEEAIKSAKWITDPKTGKKILSSKAETSGLGIFRKTAYKPGKEESEMANRLGHLVQGQEKNPEVMVANIDEFSKQNKKIVDNVAKEYPSKIRNVKQIVGDVEKNSESIKRQLVLGKDETRLSAWKSGIDTLKESLKSKAKNREGLLGSFREFNKIAANINAYEGTDNIVKQSVIAIRDSLRNELLKGLPGYSDDLSKLSGVAKQVDDALLNQYWSKNAVERIAQTGGKLIDMPSKAKKGLTEVGKTIGVAALGAGGYKILSELGD